MKSFIGSDILCFRSFIFVLAAALTMSTASNCYGALALTLSSGASSASMKGNIEDSYQGYSFSGRLLWGFSFLGLTAGLSKEYSKLQGTGASVGKSSSIDLLGPSFGFTVQSKTDVFRFLATMYSVNSMTVSRTDVLSINGKSYGYSTLESYGGQVPTSLRLDYLFKGRDKKLTLDQLTYWGGSIESLTWQLSEMSAKVNGSSDTVSPSGTNRLTINDSLQILGFYLVLGVCF